MNKNKELLLHLFLIPGIGPGLLHKVLERVSETFDFYAATVRDYIQHGVSQAVAQKLIDGLKNKTLLEQELECIEKYNISFVTFYCDEYPEQLKHIHIPPLVLFYQGVAVWTTHELVSVVGARKANYYGKNVVKNIIPGLVKNNLAVVSGGAYGIDTAAHQETVIAGGKTVVVLGSGLLKPYPSSNKKLFESVVQTGGTLMSPFPCLMAGFPGNFPARNRIIAGLSGMTLVVQAAEKSGSLITANFALEQGKSVGAIPGSIEDPLSAGCHSLIGQGAKIITGAYDILQEYAISEYRVPVQMNIEVPQEKEDPVLFACRQPRGIEELIELTKMEENKLKEYLFDLQLEGVIEQNFAGLWQKV